MSDIIWTYITGAIIVGILFVLVKPNSHGAQMVADVSNALAGLVKTTVSPTTAVSTS
jgi:hypothetical protein